MSSRRISGSAPLLLSTDHHAARGGSGSWAAAPAARMSDLFDDMPAEQARRLHEEDGDEDDERDAILVLRPAGHVPNDECLDEAEHEAADDGAGDVSDAAEDRGDERLHA